MDGVQGSKPFLNLKGMIRLQDVRSAEERRDFKTPLSDGEDWPLRMHRRNKEVLQSDMTHLQLPPSVNGHRPLFMIHDLVLDKTFEGLCTEVRPKLQVASTLAS